MNRGSLHTRRQFQAYTLLRKVSGRAFEKQAAGREHCGLFLGETLYNRSASSSTGEFKARGCDELVSHRGRRRNTPSRFMLLKRDRRWPNEPQDSFVD